MAEEPSFEILQNEVVYTKPDGTVIRTEASGNHFTIKETPEGREMICSIDAKAGDLIFCEQAYAITPETSLLTSKKLCLMCCKALRIKDANSSVNDLAPVAVHCPSCNLAFCSTECAKNIIHELECGLIPKVCEAVIEADSKGHKLELSPVLLIIRILLKGLLDKGFTLIEGMLSHVQEHSPSWRKKYEIFAEAFCRDLPANADGSKLFSEARIVEMACLLDTNAFGGVNQVTSQQLSTGLFYYSALLNNSCDPNVIYSVLDDKITMRAIKEIPKGTPLRDTYVDLLFPTRERQATLLKSKAFFCTCERCKDPSEQGRYLSAWKCGKEGCDGYMLPTVSFAKETKQITQTWACEKCGTTNKDDEGVPGQIQKLREFLAQRTWNADPASFVRIATQQCSPLLPSLHANHHLRVFYALEMANALRAQKKYDEAVVFMGQVCGIVTKIAPNTTQETDCLCQLGQLYAHLFIEASEAEKANPSTTTQKGKTEFAQLYRKATADSLRVARICLGEYHPHTIALSKTFAT